MGWNEIYTSRQRALRLRPFIPLGFWIFPKHTRFFIHVAFYRIRGSKTSNTTSWGPAFLEIHYQASHEHSKVHLAKL